MQTKGILIERKLNPTNKTTVNAQQLVTQFEEGPLPEVVLSLTVMATLERFALGSRFNGQHIWEHYDNVIFAGIFIVKKVCVRRLGNAIFYFLRIII